MVYKSLYTLIMRKMTSFKFTEKTLKFLEELAKQQNTSKTRIVEDLVLKEAIKKGLEN